MKINELEKATQITESDLFLLEQTKGTKKLDFKALVEALGIAMPKEFTFVNSLDITEKGYVSEGYLVAQRLLDLEAQIRAPFGYFGKELQLTWAEIDAKEKKGDFTGINIGDYKDVTLTTGEKIRMEVAGINTRKGYATNNENRIHWISRDCLKDLHRMNASNTNTGGFPACELKTVLNSTIYNLLPADVKAVIKKDKRLDSTKGSWAWQGDQFLWLPSEPEVWGDNSWSEVGYGNGNDVQFPIFRGSLVHINKGQGFGAAEKGSRTAWWCSSPSASNTTYFCLVNSNGRPDYFGASTALGLPVCFDT